jgi:hypothetical protein
MLFDVDSRPVNSSVRRRVESSTSWMIASNLQPHPPRSDATSTPAWVSAIFHRTSPIGLPSAACRVPSVED